MRRTAAERRLAATLAAHVRALRSARRLSLDALARRAGLAKGTVVAIERRAANPSMGVLCRLAAAFSLDVVTLLAGGAPPPPGDAIERDGART